jgi:hypothetical protein
LQATDIDRTWGKGHEIRGRAVDLLMAAVGRTATLDTLDGPGLPLLRQQISCQKRKASSAATSIDGSGPRRS